MTDFLKVGSSRHFDMLSCMRVRFRAYSQVIRYLNQKFWNWQEVHMQFIDLINKQERKWCHVLKTDVGIEFSRLLTKRHAYMLTSKLKHQQVKNSIVKWFEMDCLHNIFNRDLQEKKNTKHYIWGCQEEILLTFSFNRFEI